MNPSFDSVIQVKFGEIGICNDNISKIKADIQRIKGEMREEITRLFESNADNLTEIANDLYWSHYPGMAGHIKQAYKKATGKGLEVKPYEINFPCRKCGKNITAKSISDLEHYRALMKDAYNLDKYPGVQCDPCHDAYINEIRTSRNYEGDWGSYFEQKTAEFQSMPYAEYLKTPEWNDTRKHALKRAGYRCQTCNDAAPLDVHHRTYERLGRERINDIIALCRRCHKKFHSEENPNE
jgi:hypothetical protein